MGRLLLADGDQAVLDAHRRILEVPGRSIAAASTAGKALQLAGLLQPEAAVIDRILPDASGLELARRLKALQPEMEIVITVSFPSIESAVEAVRVGDAIEQCRARRLLLERAGRFALEKRLFDAVPEALLVHDAETDRIEAANGAAAVLYGYSAREMSQLKAADLGNVDAGERVHRRKGGGDFVAHLTITEFLHQSRPLRLLTIRAAEASKSHG